jgi:hypothetical protein
MRRATASGYWNKAGCQWTQSPPGCGHRAQPGTSERYLVAGKQSNPHCDHDQRATCRPRFVHQCALLSQCRVLPLICCSPFPVSTPHWAQKQSASNSPNRENLRPASSMVGARFSRGRSRNLRPSYRCRDGRSGANLPHTQGNDRCGGGRRTRTQGKAARVTSAGAVRTVCQCSQPQLTRRSELP